MPLWNSNGAASSNSPTHSSELYRANSYNQANAYMNTNPGAFKSSGKVLNQVFGVYGITNTQVFASMLHSVNTSGNTAHTNPFLTPGWWTVKQGMGPLTGIKTITAGSGYSNNDTWNITSAYVSNATVNCTANVLTNASGNIVGFTNISNSGGMFINAAATTLTITTGGGTLGVGNVVLGGRAGRIAQECLVSLPSMTSNSTSANNPIYPNV